MIWQNPLYWYGVPALLKLWFEDVLVRGWAYGEGGNALAGQGLPLGDDDRSLPDAYPRRRQARTPFEAFVPAVAQTARFCGMNWLSPIVVHGAHRLTSSALEATRSAYRRRLARSDSQPMAEASILRDALVYLGAAVVCVPLAKRSASARCSAT